MASEPIKVVCMECGKKFSTRSMLPVCPKCNSSDIEPREIG
jgi:Zn finger protein HypA/HybF involved in hydrogenase expression